MIRQSEKPVMELAKIFGVSRDYVYKVKKGMYRK
jgi:hypothetical protein